MTVVFDMDGTLFAGDSLLLFARWILRRCGWWRRFYLLLAFPMLLLAVLRLVSKGTAKRAFLSFTWRLTREELDSECSLFVQQVLLPAVFPELKRRIEAHLAAGDELVLCSASPNWWVRPFAEHLGFRRVIATPMQIPHRRVPLLPRMLPPGNNRDRVKLQRLAAIGITHADIGYTDSTADLPLLSICSRAVLVNPSPRLVAAAPRDAEVLRPGGISSPLAFTVSCLLGV